MVLLRAIRFIDKMLLEANEQQRIALLNEKKDLVVKYIDALRQPSPGRTPGLSKEL